MIRSNVRHYLTIYRWLTNAQSAVWDLRSFKKPLAVHSGLNTLYPNTNAVFSPDDKYVITGAGATAKGGQGRLVILKKDGLEEVKSLAVDATPVKVAWHSKINQVRCLVLGFVLLNAYLFNGSIDCDWTFKWTNRGALFPSNVLERCETVTEQGATEKGDDRGCVGCNGSADHSYAARVAHVP